MAALALATEDAATAGGTDLLESNALHNTLQQLRPQSAPPGTERAAAAVEAAAEGSGEGEGESAAEERSRRMHGPRQREAAPVAEQAVLPSDGEQTLSRMHSIASSTFTADSVSLAPPLTGSSSIMGGMGGGGSSGGGGPNYALLSGGTL
ncbi:hypothetical protein EV177_010353, partial [Coemansia sp. RSA 1804]